MTAGLAVGLAVAAGRTRIGVVAALPAEAAAYRSGGCEGSPPQLVQVSGIGAERADAAARSLLQQGATALVSWGTAGGLDPDLPAGTALLPSRVVGADGEIFAADAAWQRRLAARIAAACGARSSGPLIESPTLVATRADKAALRARTGAVAVDMESATVARLAREASVPFLAVRAVCDAAATVIPAAVVRAVTADGRVQPLRLAVALLRRPPEIAALWQLRRAFRSADATLRRIAAQGGSRLCLP